MLRVQDQRFFQAEGERGFSGHADLFTPGKELGKRTAPGSGQGPDPGSFAASKNSAHESADTRATTG